MENVQEKKIIFYEIIHKIQNKYLNVILRATKGG